MPPLNDSQIARLVLKYRRERDRYVKMASTVQQRLQTALANHHIRAVVTSRAKDMSSLQTKLHNNCAKLDFEKLMDEFCPDILDLAGARVMLYEFDKDAESVIRIINELFLIGDDPRHTKDLGLDSHRCYQARHRVASLRAEHLGGDAVDNLNGVVCEIQVVSLVKHIWNELEHDIKYKDPEHLGLPDEHQQAWLSVLWDTLHAAQTAAANLSTVTDNRRAQKRADGAPIENAEELQLALGVILQRPFSGNIQGLFELLQGTEASLSRRSLIESMRLNLESIKDGEAVADAAGFKTADDSEAVVAFLWSERGQDFAEIAESWTGPSTGLRHLIATLSRRTAPPVELRVTDATRTQDSNDYA